MPRTLSLSLLLALQLVLLLLLLPQQHEAGPVPTNRHLVRIDKGRYTLTRPLLAKRRTGSLATPPTPVTGQLLDSDAESASPRSPQDSPSIIVVPKWRVSSGCRIYQRTDPRGRCRDRW